MKQDEALPLQRTNIVEEIAGPRMPRALLHRRLSQAGLGVLRALRNSTMTIEQAESDLFNVETYKAARRRRLDPSFIEFLEWGMELDDVKELVPDGLEDSYESMEKLLLRVISQSYRKTVRKKRR